MMQDHAGRILHPYAMEILWHLALTGCRLNEIAGLSWDEVDIEAQCLRLARPKTRRSLRAIRMPAVTRLGPFPGSPGVVQSILST